MAKPPPDVDPRATARLSAPIQAYDWGSREFIARLQGRPFPTHGPEAELWIGDHPRAPSRLVEAGGKSLREHIAAHPVETIGRESYDRFGPRLPFLAKLLAAARPLSLQVHPDAHQATAGFEAEERKQIPLDAPERTYSDPSRKIEFMIAIEPFTALCGFRDEDSLSSLLAADAFPSIVRMRSKSNSSGTSAGNLFFGLRALGRAAGKVVLEELHQFANQRSDELPEAEWTRKLLELYPGDIGAVAPLLLNLVRIHPGEGLFVRPGTLHSYLDGTGFEVMSSSDNVVRGGLTSKHIDHVALEAIARRESSPPDIVSPMREEAGAQLYDLGGQRGVDEFEVRVITVGGETEPGIVQRRASGKATILFSVQGCPEVSSDPATTIEGEMGRINLRLGAGAAVWIPACAETIEISAQASSRLFEVRVP